MQSLAEFRHNMIDGQLSPNQVLSSNITAAMGVVPREAYVPEAYKHAAYLDEAIQVDKQRFLVPPLLLGQLLEMMTPQPGQRVLVVGGATGYSAAVLHQMGAKVFLLEDSQHLANQARQILTQQGLGTIEVHTGGLHAGWQAGAPYERILIEGAIEQVPATLTEQLSEGGRCSFVQVSNALPLDKHARGFLVSLDKAPNGLNRHQGASVASPILPELCRKEGFTF